LAQFGIDTELTAPHGSIGGRVTALRQFAGSAESAAPQAAADLLVLIAQQGHAIRQGAIDAL